MTPPTPKRKKKEERRGGKKSYAFESSLPFSGSRWGD
jgi:hypothetical protein